MSMILQSQDHMLNTPANIFVPGNFITGIFFKLILIIHNTNKIQNNAMYFYETAWIYLLFGGDF